MTYIGNIKNKKFLIVRTITFQKINWRAENLAKWFRKANEIEPWEVWKFKDLEERSLPWKIWRVENPIWDKVIAWRKRSVQIVCKRNEEEFTLLKTMRKQTDLLFEFPTGVKFTYFWALWEEY
jgi:hypothetical protein